MKTVPMLEEKEGRVAIRRKRKMKRKRKMTRRAAV